MTALAELPCARPERWVRTCDRPWEAPNTRSEWQCDEPRELGVRIEEDTDSSTRLPPALRRISEAIGESRSLLELAEGWDGEDARPIGEHVWKKAVQFLVGQAMHLWERGRIMPAPLITPTLDGGIDLHWDKPQYELLIHIPADADAPADFYGDDRGAGLATIKGHFDPAHCNEGLILWLMKG